MTVFACFPRVSHASFVWGGLCMHTCKHGVPPSDRRSWVFDFSFSFSYFLPSFSFLFFFSDFHPVCSLPCWTPYSVSVERHRSGLGFSSFLLTFCRRFLSAGAFCFLSYTGIIPSLPARRADPLPPLTSLLHMSPLSTTRLTS